ncbi:hypothetical protein NST63_17970 [Heyndrickxia sp. FSL W8-0496]|uniref:hypothetical protein n=1 Tax=Heyndrickxia sp. FSL W8-0496 TaxID=2954702 RepID=UPI0030FA0A33
MEKADIKDCNQLECCEDTVESPNAWLLIDILKVVTLDEDVEFREKVKKKLEQVLDL